MENPRPGPIRRAIGFVLAMALVVAGLVLTYEHLAHSSVIYPKILAATVGMTVLGFIWLWFDYIKATPDEDA